MRCLHINYVYVHFALLTKLFLVRQCLEPEVTRDVQCVVRRAKASGHDIYIHSHMNLQVGFFDVLFVLCKGLHVRKHATKGSQL